MARLYHWRWYYSIPSLVLWVVTVLAFILIKANRNPQALLILVPLLIVNVLWLVFRKAMGFRSADAEMFGMVFHSLAVGITVLWLLANRLCNRNPLVTFLLAFVIMAVLGLLGAVSYVGLEFSPRTIGGLTLLGMLASAMLLSFGLTAWRCQNRYTGLRFVLYLAFWTAAVWLATALIFFSIVLVIYRPPIPLFAGMLQLLVVGSVLGVCVYVLVFPYMILAMSSSFFRERFYACLRLKNKNIEKCPENM
ncbi:MAG: hypothetical protein MUO27_09675, partial [Sedimentisphaerales bacterium]|nr:hypothetical protein [Sedimentisphaerales bacterium]